MTLALADFVKETSVTAGTGSYSLDGAVAGFQSFVDGIGTGNTCWYSASDGVDWEVGIGTVTDSSPDTLARTTIIASSNGDAAVDWPGTTITLRVSLPASRALDDFISVRDYGAVADYNVIADAAMSTGDTELTSASTPFTAADVGKYIAVEGAGAAGVTLFTTIATFNGAGSVELTDANASGGNISAKFAEWGTDDAAAFQAALDASVTLLKSGIYIPPGDYFVSRLDCSELSGKTIRGAGFANTRIFPLQHASYGTDTGHWFDLTGANYFQLRDMQLGAYYSLAKPTTAICLLQNGANAANVVTLGPHLYVTGSFLGYTVYDYGVPSSTFIQSQFYNYEATSFGVLGCFEDNNPHLYDSDFATPATGTKSTSDLASIKCEWHSQRGTNSDGATLTFDGTENISFFAGVVSGGAEYYVAISDVDHMTFVNVTFETEGQPMPAYLFGVGSGVASINDVSYPGCRTDLVGTGVWSVSPSGANIQSFSY